MAATGRRVAAPKESAVSKVFTDFPENFLVIQTAPAIPYPMVANANGVMVPQAMTEAQRKAYEKQIEPQLLAEKARLKLQRDAIRDKIMRQEPDNYGVIMRFAIEKLLKYFTAVNGLTRKLTKLKAGEKLTYSVNGKQITLVKGDIAKMSQLFKKALANFKYYIRTKKKTDRAAKRPGEFSSVEKRMIAGQAMQAFLAGAQNEFGTVGGQQGQANLLSALPQAQQGRYAKLTAMNLFYIYNDVNKPQMQNVPNSRDFSKQLASLPRTQESVALLQQLQATYIRPSFVPTQSLLIAFNNNPSVYVPVRKVGGKPKMKKGVPVVEWTRAPNDQNLNVWQAVQQADPEFNPNGFQIKQITRIISLIFYNDVDGSRQRLEQGTVMLPNTSESPMAGQQVSAYYAAMFEEAGVKAQLTNEIAITRQTLAFYRTVREQREKNLRGIKTALNKSLEKFGLRQKKQRTKVTFA